MMSHLLIPPVEQLTADPLRLRIVIGLLKVIHDVVVCFFELDAVVLFFPFGSVAEGKEKLSKRWMPLV